MGRSDYAGGGHGAKSRCKVNPVHMLGNHDMQPDWGDGAVSYPEPLLQSLCTSECAVFFWVKVTLVLGAVECFLS